MIGTTLGDIREYIESLASDSGRYYLVCGRTGDRPVPANELTFESRPIARAAARATEQYRAALRRYDPQLPTYDVIICEGRPAGPAGRERQGAVTNGGDDGDGVPISSESTAAPGTGRGAIDFCHTIAGAVFEAIAASSHVGLETAVMDTYLDVAETIDHPDELCLRLLESIATELDSRLDPAEQASVLATAAAALPIESEPRGEFESVVDVLTGLRSTGLLGSARLSLSPIDVESGGWACSVRLEDYALGNSPERLVTLPIVVGLFARLSTRSITITDAERLDRSAPAWQVRICASQTDRPHGLVCVRERGRA